jgi:hypothetical protein
MNSLTSDELKAKLACELTPGETVEWCWQLGERHLRAYRSGCLTFAVIAFVVLCVPLLYHGGWQALTLIVPAVIVGHIVWRHRAVHRRSLTQSAYVITNRRAIVLAGPGLMDYRQTKPQIWSFYPGELLRRKVKVRKGGDGDIILWEKLWDTTSDHSEFQKIAFTLLPDVKAVDALLDRLAASTTDGRACGAEMSEKVRAATLGLDPAVIIDEHSKNCPPGRFERRPAS